MTRRGVGRFWQIILAIFVCTIAIQAVYADTGFTQTSSLSYTGTNSAPGTVFQDGVSTNPDVGVEICNQATATFAGAFYAFESAGTWLSVPISYNPGGTTLSPVSSGQSDDPTNCQASAGGFFTVSPSDLSSPYEPDIKRAAFPGQLFVGWDSSGNPGTVNNFEFGGTNAVLSGSYSVSRSFSQGTGLITVSSLTYTATGPSTASNKGLSDADYGVSTARQMVMGVCDGLSGTGEGCEDGIIIDSSVDVPASFTPVFSSGVSDQVTYNKSVVVNGLPYSMCIGANLVASITSVSPDPIYYSQNLSFNLRVTNQPSSNDISGGNVDVTTDFNIFAEIYPSGDSSNPIYTDTITITDLVAAGGGQVDTAVSLPIFQRSGDYVIRLTVDSDDADQSDGDGVIAECSDTNNQASTTFTVLPITLPTILIDGVETDAFEAPNVPYNLTINLRNSDNTTLSSADVVFTENNGINLMAPTQIYQLTTNFTTNTSQQAGINVTSTARVESDGDGNLSFTIIPAYNSLYGAAYSYTNISSVLGNYSLTFSGTEAGGQQFIFIFNGGDPQDTYPFTITNVSNTGPFTSKDLPNFDVVSQVLDFIYRSFTNFLDIAVQ